MDQAVPIIWSATCRTHLYCLELLAGAVLLWQLGAQVI
jgi:hypothetical protein